MSVSTIVTRGYGVWSTINHLAVLGYLRHFTEIGEINVWILDSRGITWILDERKTIWCLELRDVDWELENR